MEKRIEELDKNFKAQEMKGGFLSGRICMRKRRDRRALARDLLPDRPGVPAKDPVRGRPELGGEYRRRHGAVQGAGKTLCRADADHAGVGYVPYAPEREQRP